MPLHKHWLRKLEERHGEAGETLIPRLLNEYGKLGPLAEEAGVSEAVISRWCKDHNITFRRVWEREGLSA